MLKKIAGLVVTGCMAATLIMGSPAMAQAATKYPFGPAFKLERSTPKTARSVGAMGVVTGAFGEVNNSVDLLYGDVLRDPQLASNLPGWFPYAAGVTSACDAASFGVARSAARTFHIAPDQDINNWNAKKFSNWLFGR